MDHIPISRSALLQPRIVCPLRALRQGLPGPLARKQVADSFIRPALQAPPAAFAWREESNSVMEESTGRLAGNPSARGSGSSTAVGDQQGAGQGEGRRVEQRDKVDAARSDVGQDGLGNGVHPRSRPGGGQPSAQQQRASTQRQATGADTVLTFAYGANMNFLTLARREVRVLSRDPAVVADPTVRLVFKHQGGYATLERAEEAASKADGKAEPRFRPYDGQIHGVLYRVTREDFAKLSKREGGYMVQEIPVRTYDGTQHTALAFVSNPLFKLPQEVLPTERYLSAVREGARDNYLDPAYQAFLSGINTVPSAGLGADYFNTPSKYMGYSFLVVVALIAGAFFFQH